MAEQSFASIRDWVEPAHPSIVKLHDDLVSIYGWLKERQDGIDGAFDRASRQVGFVVATTLPVVFEVAAQGAVKGITMGAEHLKGTIFEKEVLGSLKERQSLPGQVAPGSYRLYVIWRDALKLKLRTDWMEPAHLARPGIELGRQVAQAAKVRPEVMEPVHWFDPGTMLAVEDAVIIAVIDEVYPELRLVDRVGMTREMIRVRPEVMEPAHFRVGARGVDWEQFASLLRRLRE